MCPCLGLGPGAAESARPVVDAVDQRVVGWDWKWVGESPPAAAQLPVLCPGAEQGPAPDPPGSCLLGRKGDGRSAYRAVQEQGFATDARQKGIWRSIGDESLAPLAHLQEAMALPLGEGDRTSVMSSFMARPIEEAAALPLGELQRARRERIDHWAHVAAELPHAEDEPFHSRPVKAMDEAIDLFDRGPMRHSAPNEATIMGKLK